MGKCASLFYSKDREVTLHRNVRPSDEQIELQQERWNELGGELKQRCKASLGYEVSTWLQGSYKFGTQIRPPRKGDEFDVDLGLYFCWDSEEDDGETPIKLRTTVQQHLQDLRDELPGITAVIAPPKPRCCRVRYDEDFHIDVPVYHLDEKSDERTLATENGWEASDPQEIYDWWCSTFDDYDRDKARRHVRYMKFWARLTMGEDGPSSVLLTVLVAEAILTLEDDEWSSDDDGFRNIVAAIHDRLAVSTVVKNPVDDNEDLAERLGYEGMRRFKGELKQLLETADEALAAANTLDAAEAWKKAFEHYFPMPEESEVATSKSALLVPWVQPEISVTAVSRRNSAASFTGRNRIGPIPRDCTITFTVANQHQLPAGCTIWWTVRNAGTEAEEVNDMGHLAGTGFTATEHSAYDGVHYMDCVVKLYGKSVGFRRVQVEVSGTYKNRRQRRLEESLRRKKRVA